MRTWWLLGWDTYYPRGGLGNVLSTHETQDEAEAAMAVHKKQAMSHYVHDNYEIVDIRGRV